MNEKKHWALIGGAAGLIGGETLREFKERDYQAYGADIRPGGGRQIDLSDEDEVAKLFDETFDEKAATHTLVNCQAIADPFNSPIEELSLEEWNSYMAANLQSSFLMCREFVRRLKGSPNRSASIVNFSSTRHLMAEENNEAYSATKGAVASFTKALAVSLSNTGIRANCVSPGWIAGEREALSAIDHQQHPAGRVGGASDVAKLCLYLASPDSRFVDGQDIVIDGGMTVKMIYE